MVRVRGGTLLDPCIFYADLLVSYLDLVISCLMLWIFDVIMLSTLDGIDDDAYFDYETELSA